MKHPRLGKVVLPDFGLPRVEPVNPSAVYPERVAALEKRCTALGYDLTVVYADREHFANMAYLINYDPRFEEALLVLRPGRPPVLLVGNEGMGYARAAVPLTVKFELFQSFSLLSQPRDESRPLDTILAEAGATRGAKVGSIGWKYYTPMETANPARWLEIPAFIVDTLRELGCEVSNATELLMHPSSGMRAVNEVDQLAVFEYSATCSSEALRGIIFGARPGMTEFEALQLGKFNGLPTNIYPLLLSGKRTELCLGNPSSKRLERGDPVFSGIGYWGSNTCRAGFLARDAGDLPVGIRDYIAKLVVPYFRAAVAWYQTVGIGVTGSELYNAVHHHVGDPFFGVKLNPGHLVHLDEWLSSPIYRGSTEKLCSGMAFQVDIIPATGTAYWTSNIEDGIALADEPLRRSFARKYPEAWQRIEQRRAFMRDVLHLALKPEILPFSNLPAYLPPFWLSPDTVMLLD